MKQLILFASIAFNVMLLSVSAQAQVGCSGAHITVSGRILGCSMKMESYEWMDCATFTTPLADGIGQYYYVTKDGDYTVIVTIGSCRDTLACVTVSGLGVSGHTVQRGLTLFPNPSSGKLQLQCGGLQGRVDARITDVLGRSVAQYDMMFTNGAASLDLSLPAGSYWLHLRDGAEHTAAAALIIK